MSLSQILEYSPGAEGWPIDWPPLLRIRRRVWRLFTSARLVVVLLILLAVAATVGTLVPAPEPDTHDGALVRVLGLRDLYHSFWFNGIIALLALNTLCCSLSRLRLKWRSLVSTATHGGIVLILLGAGVGGWWGVDGHVRLVAGQPAAEFVDRTGRSVALGFVVTLEESWTETSPVKRPVVVFACKDDPAPRRILLEEGRSAYAVAGTPFTVRLVRRIEEFSRASGVPDPVRGLDALRGPALVLDVERDGRRIARRIHFAHNPRVDVNRNDAPDVSTAYLLEPVVENYASRLVVKRDDEEQTATVRVNDPLVLGSTRLFQMDQDHQSNRWTLLRVNRDPGLQIVYGGFALLAAGVALVFTPFGGKRRLRRRTWKAS